MFLPQNAKRKLNNKKILSNSFVNVYLPLRKCNHIIFSTTTHCLSVWKYEKFSITSFFSKNSVKTTFYKIIFLHIDFTKYLSRWHKSGNLLSLFFGKNFVKVKFLLKKILNTSVVDLTEFKKKNRENNYARKFLSKRSEIKI